MDEAHDVIAPRPELGSARLGSARLGSARLGSARLGHYGKSLGSVCQPPNAEFRVRRVSAPMLNTEPSVVPVMSTPNPASRNAFA